MNLRARRAWYEDRSDPLACARGVLWGIPIGAAMWTAMLLVWWWVL